MLTLLAFPPAFNVQQPSPFIYKADMLIKMSGQPYEVVVGDSRKTPNKKLPALKDGDKIIPDSEGIRVYLDNKYKANFDAHLSEAERMDADTIRIMVEQQLYWIMYYSRWGIEENLEKVKEAFFGSMPWFVRKLIVPQIIKQVKKDHWAQGVSRLDEKEVFNRGLRILEILHARLDKPGAFAGEKVSSIDATLVGFIDNILRPPFETPLKEMATSDDVFASYVNYVREQVYGDKNIIPLRAEAA